MRTTRRWNFAIRAMSILLLAFALLSPLSKIAFADDGGTPEPPVPDGQQDTSEEATVGDEGEAGDTATEDAQTPTEPPTEDGTGSVDGEPSDAEGEGSDAPPEATEESDAAPADESIEGDQDVAPPELTEVPPIDGSQDAPDEGEDAPPESTVIPDPFFTIGPTTYTFASIQAAIDQLIALDDSPDDNTIYVEDGTYVEPDVEVDGSLWDTSTPMELIIESLNGSATTIIEGSFSVFNMNNFVLRGFTVTNGVTAIDNDGTLTLEDVVASGSTTDGIVIEQQNGEVILNEVEANDNQELGAVIISLSDVTITNSTFNNNNQTPTDGTQGGLAILSLGTVTLENVEASGNLDGDGAYVVGYSVTIKDSTFNDNTSQANEWGNGLWVNTFGGPIELQGVQASRNEESGAVLSPLVTDPDNQIKVSNSRFKDNGGFGVWAQPEDGTVTFHCVYTSGNAWGGVMVPVGQTVVWVKCLPTCEDSKDPYKTVPLKTDASRYVNVGHGVMVKFPPIELLDEEDKAYGRYLALIKPDELPSDLPPTDLFMVGVETLIYNGVIPEGEFVTVEFYIAGYQWDENFAVLWWDAEALEWVDVPFTKVPHERMVGGKIVAEWPETGIFVLVLRGSPPVEGTAEPSSK